MQKIPYHKTLVSSELYLLRHRITNGSAADRCSDERTHRHRDDRRTWPLIAFLYIHLPLFSFPAHPSLSTRSVLICAKLIKMISLFWLIDWLIDWLINWLIDWLIECSLDFLITYMTDCFFACFLICYLALKWCHFTGWFIDWLNYRREQVFIGKQKDDLDGVAVITPHRLIAFFTKCILCFFFACSILFLETFLFDWLITRMLPCTLFYFLTCSLVLLILLIEI